METAVLRQVNVAEHAAQLSKLRKLGFKESFKPEICDTLLSRPSKPLDFHRFSSIFIVLHRFSSISVDFCCSGSVSSTS